jgi:hypothetical protein
MTVALQEGMIGIYQNPAHVLQILPAKYLQLTAVFAFAAMETGQIHL